MEFDTFDSSLPSQTMESQSQIQSQMEENQKRKRKNNYLQDEDEALVKAWLHVSEDAVVGRDQKSTKLWLRVLQCFHEILGRTTERNSQGLQNRWQIISHDVSKFCGHYNKIGRLNRSGWSDQMIIDEAKQQFAEIEGPLQAKPVPCFKFKYEYCWKILKDSSKWNDQVLMRNTTKVSKKPSKLQSQGIDLDDLGSPPLSTPSPPGLNTPDEAVFLDDAHNLVRPEGQRKTKAKRMNQGKDDESTSYLKSINETLKDAAVIEKEKLEAKKSFEEAKLEAKRRRIEQKEMHEERKVMSQSLVGLTSEQVAYWKVQQSAIVERYKANGLMQDPEIQGNNFDFEF